MRGRTGKALFWTLLDVGASQGLSFLLYVILTRILTPGDYGVFALSLSVTSILNIVAFQGFGDALIQREATSEDDRSTAFWTTLALGTLLGLGLALAAPYLARAFEIEALGPVLQAMSLLCPLRALISVQTALCRRDLHVAIFALRAIGAYLVGGAIGIALALRGWGIWSLVICQIVQALFMLVVMWTTVSWVPRLRFSYASFRALAGFSRHFLAASLLISIADKIDNLVIGLVLDAPSVGHYNLALKVLQAAGLLTMAPLLPLLLPVLSRLAHDRAAFRDEYVRLVSGCLVMAMPLAAGLGILAPQLVPLAFGPQWDGAVPVLQAMCLGSAVAPLWSFTGQALSAQGQPKRFAWLASLQVLLASAAFLAASLFGIVAVGFAWTLVSIALVPLHVVTLKRVVGVSFAPLLMQALRIAAATLSMVVAMVAEAQLLGGPIWLTAATGILVYVVAIELAFLPGYLSRLLQSAWSLLRLADRPS
ncbi:MAG: lipopolysaccharide biosynthesis protein [Paracraurococcus sp.]